MILGVLYFDVQGAAFVNGDVLLTFVDFGCLVEGRRMEFDIRSISSAFLDLWPSGWIRRNYARSNAHLHRVILDYSQLQSDDFLSRLGNITTNFSLTDLLLQNTGYMIFSSSNVLLDIDAYTNEEPGMPHWA